MDFCIVVKELWKLSMLKRITKEERQKIRHNAFASLSVMVDKTVRHIDNAKERREIICHLHQETLNMFFSNGWKQRTTTFLLHHAPLLYLSLQEKRKR